MVLQPTGSRIFRRRGRCRAAWALLTAAVVLALAGAGCGHDNDRSAAGSGSTKFVRADFAHLPRYPDSTAVGRTTRSGATSTRSFSVEQSSPMKVLRWYGNHLGGWTEVEAPHAIGAGPQLAARARWRQDGSVLRVSAELAPGLGNGGGAVQYDLQLQG